MISSEVQRTLVKSPPELWAELSDPESLARHLGELGEIRITRTEPESRVEWEAEGTTGAVQLKASGWGTKVTLTVSRELPPHVERAEEAPQDPARSEVAEEAPQDSAQSELAGSEDEAQTSVEAVSADRERPDADGDAHAPEPDAASPAEPEDAQPSAQAAMRPATEAARRAAGWPGETEPAGPAIESDLRAAEADGEAGGALSLPAPRAPWHLEDAPSRSAAEATPVPESRRGFFARLFGRRRRTPDAVAPEILDRPGVDAQSHAEDADPPPGAPREWETEPVAGEPISVEQAGEAAALDPDPEGPEPTRDVSPEADERAPQPETEHGPQAAEQPLAASREPAGAEEPEPEQPAPTPDIAAELKAAEEVAVEEVKAVLSAVLDRLGAAHHRPFSRS
jgi:hypothetical protein